MDDFNHDYDIMSEELAHYLKMAIDQGQLPRYVYKYRYLDARLDEIIAKNELWFSKPDQFNDPFDCQIVPDFNVTKEDLNAFLRKNSPSLTEEVVNNIVSNLLANRDKLEEIVSNSIKDKINNSGVCCCCAIPDNILLWAHYSDSHRGVCLKFDMLADLNFFVSPLTMTYQKEYPVYNHFKDEKDFFKRMVMTKSDHWNYEQEIRIFKPSSGLKKFNKSALVELIFGARVSSNDVIRLKELARINGYGNLSFSKSELRKKEYGLDFTPLP